MPNERLILGAMSGTSADGVDVALTHITGRGLEMQAKLLTHAYHAYSPELRKQILEMRQRGDVKLADLAEMGRQVTLAYVEACKLALKQGNVSADQVAAIAAHGQTLFHGPPNTIQYFDPSLLAYETGIAVVSDFRRADLAAGGQGAPLVPFADWILFRHPTKSRVILNIGGIANITYLKASGSIDEVIAFDTGPGNCISDWLCARFDPDGPGFDMGGSMAARGAPMEDVIQRVFASGFMLQPPPKSTDGPAMIELFHSALSALRPEALHDAESDEFVRANLICTAITISALGVMNASKWVAGGVPDEILIAGGGSKNAEFLSELEFHFPHRIKLADEFGLPADAREALAFALLGAATLDGEPSNVPSATGASRRVVLGSTTPKTLS